MKLTKKNSIFSLKSDDTLIKIRKYFPEGSIDLIMAEIPETS